ncbi:MAG: hypothetical protein K9K66_18045 [Desulfarculaceae bacterium]|nr:hypothetical protein [Desulfarculaceae bacterium]MCF8074337.1 hypothetical protein [Desulfarculaceae bacterium]MCF8103563.1 hypothetical protein [Desulfarculaceae bacterium]MCF8117330.1 hypothetical protein [Desulfarculaceae bacterium]
MSRELRRLELKAIALQGESDLLRLRFRDHARDLGRVVDKTRQALALGILAWNALAALWARRDKDRQD